MILQELKQYVIEHKRVSRKQLSIHFGMSEDGVDAMLAVWVRKGVLGKELVGCNESQDGITAKSIWYRSLAANELAITIMR